MLANCANENITDIETALLKDDELIKKILQYHHE